MSSSDSRTNRSRLLRTLVATGAMGFACATTMPTPGPIVVDYVDSADRKTNTGFLIQDETLRGIVRAEGLRVYDERCTPCHGDTGHGDGVLADVLPIRPRNYHKGQFKWGTRPSDIVETIRNGRSSVMPPFGGELSESELWAAAYLVWSWVPEDRRDVDDPSTMTTPIAAHSEEPTSN